MAESFRSSLDPGISERTNAPLSFFLFFIFIFLPSSRVDLFKGPRLIDPRDPRGDLFGRLWYKQSDTWWSMQSSCRDETSRNAKVQELSAFTGVPDSDNTPRRECLAWKNRYFSTYRETDANLQKVIPCFYRIIVFYTELMDSWEDIIFFLHRKL